MPLMECQIDGQEGYKWGETGTCYIGPDAKEKATKQGQAIEISKRNTDFIPPPFPPDLPEEAQRILKRVYNENRKKWVEEHPRDPENAENKRLSAQIAWTAVENAGYKKNQQGKWVKSDEENMITEQKNNTVIRIDVFELAENALVEPFRETPEGFLRGRAIFTNTGIFNYRQADGTILKELRTPEDVGNEDALNSFKNMPITNSHPNTNKYPEGVNKDNAKELSVGYTGSDVRFDGHAVSIDITITDGETIRDIKEHGKVALSAGYDADLEMHSGYAFGNNAYDAVQKNIRGNHIAVVDRGRAGDLAKIKLRMGTNDAICIDENIQSTTITRRKKMAKIIINDVEFEADARVAEEFSVIRKNKEDLQKQLADKDTQISKLTADADSSKEKLEALQEENEKLKKDATDETKIQEAIKTRIALTDVAIKHEVEIKEDMNDVEIKKAVIMKAFPKADLAEKDIVYIDARYDSALEILDERTVAENKKTVADIKPDVSIKKDEAISKREKYLTNAWKLNSDQAEKYRNGVITDEMKEILEGGE